MDTQNHAPISTHHATAVCLDQKAVLITGPSGSGKSSLAFALMNAGAKLIADDQVILESKGSGVIVSCPPQIDGLIEARGIGVLHAPAAGPTALSLVVDLGRTETERVPPQRNTVLLGHAFPVIYRVDSPHFALFLLHLLSYGRSDR